MLYPWEGAPGHLDLKASWVVQGSQEQERGKGAEAVLCQNMGWDRVAFEPSLWDL